MVKLRESSARGYADHGWLKSYHTFSFADYLDPQYMGFSTLRVINEDFVMPGMGFSTHPHRDMEIITYVLEGALEHKDSMGTGSVIRPGEVQIMSAGTGLTHSEYNHSKESLVHLLQIWILPDKKGLTPLYQQKKFEKSGAQNQFQILVSQDGREGSLKINQNADLSRAILNKGSVLDLPLEANRNGWIQLARGTIKLNGVGLGAGDGAAIQNEHKLKIEAVADSEILFFNLS